MTDFCRTDMPMNQRIFLSLSGGSQPPPAILVADYKKVCLCKPQYFLKMRLSSRSKGHGSDCTTALIGMHRYHEPFT